MDTKLKYGISKNHAILLFVQMVLTIIGFLSQLGILIFLLTSHSDTSMIISSISILLCYLVIIGYAIFGYKRRRIYYLLAVIFFMVAIVINGILPFRDMVQRILLMLLLIMMTSFIMFQENYKLDNIIIMISTLIALCFSIYSLITSNVQNGGGSEFNFITVLLMVLSIFTPVIVTGVFGVTYIVRKERNI